MIKKLPDSWIQPDWPAPANVRALITTREGGVSTGPYASLNLGTRTDDDSAAVAENRTRLNAHLPQPPRWLAQVHGSTVVDADVLQDIPQADASVLACRLETGRTHQIRVHLQKLGHPIWGDPVYGKRNAPAVPHMARQALHAEKLALTHPLTGKIAHWQAPLPEDMQQLIAELRSA